MRFIAFFLILLSPLFLYGEERFVVSEFFETPNGITEYVNKLPNDLKASAQFVTESDGKSERVGYAVVTDREFLKNNPHIPAKHYTWYYRDKMPNFPYADRFIKGLLPDEEPAGPDPRIKFQNLRLQVVDYWNPFLEPFWGTVTMFYIAVDSEPRLCSYNIVDIQFEDSKEALEFGNGKKDIGAMFSSETHLVNRMESFLKVILSTCNSGVGETWKLVENDENGFPFNLAAAIKHINRKDYKNVNLVPINSLWRNRSRIAIFYQEK
jgi:hypothetical protein